MIRLSPLLVVALGLILCLALPAVCSAAPSRPRAFRPRDPLTAHYQRQRLASAPSAADSPYNWTTLTYRDQYVDHFGFAETRKFEQRYLVNTQYWRPPSHSDGPGPIFFYCGNEGYIETFAGNSGFMFDIAGQYGALLLFVEHRYYGHSFPFGSPEDAYANTSALQYLTSEQAIADFAHFLTWYKSDPSTECQGQCVDVPVIGFGGSYGGMLSSWMRIKYPHVLAGAIAASAPIWQFYGLVAPTMYNNIITRDYMLDTVNCAAGIQKGWDIIEHLAQSKEGLQRLTDVFKPCNVSTFTPDTVGSILGFLSEAFGFMAMAESDARATRPHMQYAAAITSRAAHCCDVISCVADQLSLSGRVPRAHARLSRVVRLHDVLHSGRPEHGRQHDSAGGGVRCGVGVLELHGRGGPVQ